MNISATNKQKFEDELKNTSPPHQENNPDINRLSTKFTQAIMGVAQKTVATKKRHNKLIQNKPWFDRECSTKLNALEAFKGDINIGSTAEEHDNLRLVRREYKRLYKRKKKVYYKNIEDALNQARNASEYWNSVNKLRPRPSVSNPISPQEWERFYRLVLPPKSRIEITLESHSDAELDRPIDLTELEQAIKGLKNRKSPGLDGITNEAIKALPNNWKEELLLVFNRILDEGTVPEDWSKIEVVPLLKNGDPKDPDNYRGISLVSCLAKLFTTIINNSLISWAEQKKIIPESQAGFRKARGCTEQISKKSLYNICGF